MCLDKCPQTHSYVPQCHTYRGNIGPEEHRHNPTSYTRSTTCLKTSPLSLQRSKALLCIYPSIYCLQPVTTHMQTHNHHTVLPYSSNALLLRRFQPKSVFSSCFSLSYFKHNPPGRILQNFTFDLYCEEGLNLSVLYVQHWKRLSLINSCSSNLCIVLSEYCVHVL